MRNPEKIFLVYSAILAIFLAFSADFPLQFIFLPLLIYFEWVIFSQIKNSRRKDLTKSSEHHLLGKKGALVLLAVFFVLLGIGFINLRKTQAEKQDLPIVAEQNPNSPEEPQEASLSTVQTQNKESIEVRVEGDSFVNVREQPDKLSKIIGIAKNGERYELLSVQEEWYEIPFDKKHGFINKEFATTGPSNKK